MKQRVFIIICLLQSLVVKSQSLYQCQYGFDQEPQQTVTVNFNGNMAQMELDAVSLSEGIHVLFIQVRDTTGMWCAARNYLFYKKPEQINSANSENVTYHCWFDEDFEHEQTGQFGTGQILLDADALESGIHLLNVALEGEGLSSTQTYMFYKMPEQINPTNPENVTYHCWFDEDFEHEQTGPFGTGIIQLNTLLLGEGEHTVYILLKSEALTTTQSYTFEKHMIDGHIILTIANPTGAGTLSGQGWYELGDTCALIATANQGYVFENWSNQGNIVSDSTTYSFTVTEDSTFVANFVEMIVLDTTIYAEICYGEDYIENGFEIIQPEVGIGNYSMLLHPAFNSDSIVNLALTVHPTYYIVEDTTLCEMTPFYWHGNTYTESGLYYDTLQTIHGCDSIYALSLEFFNTPLGEFTYMTPTNNYPFTSLPITFSWDAVSGAEYYDLYVWDVEEQMPEEPFVSNLRNGSYNTSALLNYHTYNWFVTARNACYETSSSVKSFYLDITPSLEVNVNHIDFGEVAMSQSTSTTVSVTGIVLEDILNVEITGEDASMFSFIQASGWNNYNGGILIVTFNPTTPQYSYNANLVVSSGTVSKTALLTGAVSNLYTFNTYVAEDVYAMNSQIPIYGSVTDWNNSLVADAEVEIGVFVMGMKRTLQATTNASGQFSAVFEPMPSESGYYTVNSGRVGNHSTAVHDDFNIPGMALVSSDYILCAVTQDQPRMDSILIRNKSNLDLSNIQVSPISVPDGASFSFIPLSLSGLEENWLVYTVTGSTLTQGNYYEEAKLKASSSEGAEMNISIWYYCMEPRGVLDVMPKSLAATMTKGKSKIVDVMLTNNGTAATGNITIDLPDVEWMSVVGNDTMSSIAVNDTAYFSLRFSPAEDIQLGQYSGTIAINSERGDAVALPYTITAVSDSTGTLVVDVTDDFTWNTNNGNGPHLEGAEVTLKGYYSLETVAYGFTDADGHFSVEDLPEGYYRLSVTAERHTDYNSVVFVEAGATGRSYTDVYLQYQAITYSWIVEPTEIPDEYTYELDVVFETHVPVPVITIEHSGIHDLEYGESANFNLVITNHGLISAFDTHIYFSESSEYTFVPLYDVIDTLSALTTVVIPGTYYRIENRLRSSDGDCDVHCMTISLYYCNLNGSWTSLIQGRSLPFGLGNYEICRPDGGGIGWGGFAHLNTNIAFPTGIEIIDPHGPPIDVPIETEEESCTPCVDALVNAIADCVSEYVPGGCYLTSAISNVILAWIHGNHDVAVLKDILLSEVECAIDDRVVDPILNYVTGGLYGATSCLRSLYRNLSECIKIDIHDQIINHSRNNLDNIQNTIDGLYYSALYYSNELEFVKSFFPEDVWEMEENISEFFSQFRRLIDSETGLIPDDVAADFASTFVGTSVTYDDIINFVNRWNRSMEYWSNGYLMVSDLPIGYDTNFIQIDTSMINYMIEIEDYYASIGYESIQELYEESVQNAEIIAENASQSSICASVKVRFSQKMTMTREAFEGTFTVHNGHDSVPMEAIGLDFIITDEDGNVCNNLFQINTQSLNNLTEIDGSGSLGASLDGVAKIQFIPTQYAAPTEPKVYYFGGTFSFIDPYTLDEIVYDLYPVEITVNPSPDLYVDYFMQRDILGDDALTEDVVEPIVPAELGVIIHNQGAGMAKNVLLETAEPQIIDNDKGLAIDFAMYGASFNGSPRQLGLMEIPFGNIGSGQTAVGEWLFTSSLLGHFVSYEAHVIHNSSYGNSDLSLVSHLGIHELIHPIYAYGNLDDGINDFLVNDTPDAYDQPDSIYFSQGGRTAVGIVETINFDHYVEPLDTIVTLTINPSRIGWNYGVTDDPGRDKYELVSCMRNLDDQVIPLNNVWQTFVSIPDGGDPVYENKLHIVDTLSSNAQSFTYTLVYSLKSDLLDVVEITGIPENTIDYPLESFMVKFNEAIIDSTFTYEDMTLKCQNGPDLMNSSVVITKVSDSIYDVNISGLTGETGYYVLNVNTMNIKDLRGYEGYNGKQVTWVQALANYTQTLTLAEGWNWWSSYIDLTNSGLTKLEDALGNNAIMVKSQRNGFVTYDDGDWYGNLSALDNRQMYRVQTNAETELSLSGLRTDLSQLNIGTVEGWNWIGYPVPVNQPIANALSELNADNGDMLKSQTKFAVFDGDDGWFGGLTQMAPGQGYMYNGGQPHSFQYPNGRANAETEQEEELHWKTNAHAYPDNMSVVAVVVVDGEEQHTDRLEVGAFSDGELVGSSLLLYNAKRDRWFAMIPVSGHGGEEVNFQLYDAVNGYEFGVEAEERVGFTADGILGGLDNPMELHFNTMTGTEENGVAMLRIYPNPVSKGGEIRLSLPDDAGKVRVEIYNVLDVLVCLKEISGNTVRLNSSVSPGTYILKVFTDMGKVYYGKLIVK